MLRLHKLLEKHPDTLVFIKNRPLPRRSIDIYNLDLWFLLRNGKKDFMNDCSDRCGGHSNEIWGFSRRKYVVNSYNKEK